MKKIGIVSLPDERHPVAKNQRSARFPGQMLLPGVSRWLTAGGQISFKKPAVLLDSDCTAL
jgi:hypothetical protein